MTSASFFIAYWPYTGTGARVPAFEYYDSSAMTLLAYAVRRAIGALVVLLLLVLLLQLAIDSIDPNPIR